MKDILILMEQMSFCQKIHEPLEELNKDIEKLEGKKAELQGKIVNLTAISLKILKRIRG